MISKRISFETLAVVIPAYLCALLIRAEVTWHPFFALASCIPCISVCLVYLYAPNFGERYGSWFILLLACLPWGWDLVATSSQSFFPTALPTEPNELLLLGSLQNIAIGLACISRSPKTKRLTMFASMMLSIFCVVIVAGLQIAFLVYAIAFVQTILIVWWLMGDYWERLEHRFIGPTQSTLLKLQAGWIGLSLTVLCLMAAVGVCVAPKSARLSGFLPTSGGSQRSDDRAMSGLGDGNILVGGQDSADSFGPVDTNLFIEDKQPSLYDVATEAFGEAKINNRFNLAANLDGARVRFNHSKLAESEKTGREFRVAREQPRKSSKRFEESYSNALIHYKGEVPQRLAIATFARFDGQKWTNDPPDPATSKATPRLTFDQQEKPWISVGSRSSTEPVDYQRAAVRWLGLKSTRITIPDGLEEVHIDRIDRPNFFAWTHDEILEMVDRERIPIFTQILMKYGVRPSPAIRTYQLRDRSSEEKHSSELEMRSSEWEAALADWIQDCESDEEKINSLLTKLRNEFTLDPMHVVEDEQSNAISYFVESKRGPAYLFATTAASMLTKMGFKTRIANGFYIDKGDYDHRSGHYAATSDNLHWWPQIQLSDGGWLSLEPTPGYEPPREQWRWQDRVALMSKALLAGMTSHPLLTLFLLATCMSLHLFWKQLADGIFTMQYRIASLISDELRFEWAIWLIEKRASLAGVGRPASQTPKRWYPKLVETTLSERSYLELLIEREYLKRYAPVSMQERSLCFPIDNSKQVTNRILARWTLRNMQASKRCPIHSGI